MSSIIETNIYSIKITPFDEEVVSMTIAQQWQKLKDNWLLILIPIVLLMVLLVVVGFTGRLGSFESSYSSYEPSASAPSYREQLSEAVPMRGDLAGGVAPDVKDRLIAKTASISTEVERGQFDEAESQLKAITKSSDAYVLNENVQIRGAERAQYKTGDFTIKVESRKYDAFVQQLKGIGEVQRFEEQAEDITDIHADVNITLDGERERLKRYKAMYAEATDVSDKIELSDRIFNQENTIKYLEDILENLDQRVVYSSVDMRLVEKQSKYADIKFIGFAELAATFIGSLSGLFAFLVAVLPWVVALGVIVWAWRKLRSKKR